MLSTSIFPQSFSLTVIVLLSLVLISCEKEYYVQTLNLTNETDQSLTVHLYAKPPYYVHEGMYNIEIDDPTSITGKPTVFVLDSEDVSIIYTHDVESSPVELINMVFDSIIVEGEGTQYPIILKSGTSSIYPENPFESKAAWDAEALDYPAECSMSCPNAHFYQTRQSFALYTIPSI